MSRQTAAAVVVAVLAALALGFGVGALLDPTAPHCPSEDSCTIDFRDGAWFIDGEQVSR